MYIYTHTYTHIHIYTHTHTESPCLSHLIGFPGPVSLLQAGSAASSSHPCCQVNNKISVPQCTSLDMLTAGRAHTIIISVLWNGDTDKKICAAASFCLLLTVFTCWPACQNASFPLFTQMASSVGPDGIHLASAADWFPLHFLDSLPTYSCVFIPLSANLCCFSYCLCLCHRSSSSPSLSCQRWLPIWKQIVAVGKSDSLIGDWWREGAQAQALWAEVCLENSH